MNVQQHSTVYSPEMSFLIGRIQLHRLQAVIKCLLQYFQYIFTTCGLTFCLQSHLIECCRFVAIELCHLSWIICIWTHHHSEAYKSQITYTHNHNGCNFGHRCFTAARLRQMDTCYEQFKWLLKIYLFGHWDHSALWFCLNCTSQNFLTSLLTYFNSHDYLVWQQG